MLLIYLTKQEVMNVKYIRIFYVIISMCSKIKVHLYFQRDFCHKLGLNLTLSHI